MFVLRLRSLFSLNACFICTRVACVLVDFVSLHLCVVCSSSFAKTLQISHRSITCVECPGNATMEGHLKTYGQVTVNGLHFNGRPGRGHVILTGAHTTYEITDNWQQNIRLETVNDSRIILHGDKFFRHSPSSEIVVGTGGTLIWQDPRRPSNNDPGRSFFVTLNDDGQFLTRGTGVGLLRALRVRGEGGLIDLQAADRL